MSACCVLRSPGTLEQRHWERVAWEEPVDESIATWLLANASDTDRTQDAKFVCRSLAGSLDNCKSILSNAIRNRTVNIYLRWASRCS